MVPNISSSPLSRKPAPRDWQHPRQGTTYVRVLCLPAHLPATDRFPWHPTKSSFQVSVPVYRGAAPLFSPLASLLLPALCPSVALGSSSPPSLPTAGPLPCPAASCTISCPLRPRGLGAKAAGEGDHACTPSSPSLPLALGQAVSRSWHKPTCRCPPEKSLAF